MKEKQVILMNFSGIYERESFYKKYPEERLLWIDCRDISGTNCYCDEEGERSLKKKMEVHGPEGIHFLDSGNYHYVTKLWLDLVKEPFDLLVLDHHTDMQSPMFGDILSCGGWIRTVLEQNPWLNRVFLAGPPAEAVKEAENDLSPRLREKVTWISEEVIRKKEYRENPCCISGSGEKNYPVYLSVDKDILSFDSACTNWDQGRTEREEAADFIRSFLQGRTFIGADICGENPEGAEGPEADAQCRINEDTNELLLETVFACLEG